MFDKPSSYMPNHPYAFNPNQYHPPATHQYGFRLGQGVEEVQNTMLLLIMAPIALIGVGILAVIAIKIAQKKSSTGGD